MRYPNHVRWSAVIVLLLIGVCGATLRAQSIFTQLPDDPGAVVLTAEQFAVKGAGVADDSEGIQQAMDRGRGAVVFIPQGGHRLTKTVYVPSGMRVIRYDTGRLVSVLDDTPLA